MSSKVSKLIEQPIKKYKLNKERYRAMDEEINKINTFLIHYQN